jgi:dTDP-4-dehydrorhamnose 3,5-epimerase
MPGAERGIRWNDPAFGIEWPISDVIVSEKDTAWPDYDGEGAR